MQNQLLINGELVAGEGEKQAVYNPATGDVLLEIAEASEAQVDAAVQAADRAFTEWGQTTPKTRAECLLKLADVIEANADAFANLESLNCGKPLHCVQGDEIPAVVDVFRFFAGAARCLNGLAAGEYLEGHTSMIRRDPVGVVASIAPWNYPLMMAAWKLAPALAAGNCVVIKPSEITPLTALKLAEKAGAKMDTTNLTIRMMGPMTMCRSKVKGEMAGSAYSIYVNLNGERFVSESSQLRMGVFDSGSVLVEQPEGKAFVIFDENNLRHAIEAGEDQPQPQLAMPFGASHFPETMEEAKADMLPALEKNDGVLFMADTVEELAEKIGVPPQKLKETFSLTPEVLADIESGDYMFGRGALDMKSGVVCHMHLVKYFSEHPEELDGNLVQIAECDEEDNSHGIITAIDYLLDLKKKEHFEYVACINADYSTNYMPMQEADKKLDTLTYDRILGDIVSPSALDVLPDPTEETTETTSD